MFKRTIRTVGLVVLTLLFVVFAVVNRATVHLSLFPLPYDADMPQFLFAMLCFVCGIVIGWVAFSLKLSKSHRLFKKEHKRVMALQNEVSSLHSKPQELFPAALPKT